MFQPIGPAVTFFEYNSSVVSKSKIVTDTAKSDVWKFYNAGAGTVVRDAGGALTAGEEEVAGVASTQRHGRRGRVRGVVDENATAERVASLAESRGSETADVSLA